ncbi:MAG: Hepar II III N domain-containing protein, partial [Bacteroidetes bacterium]|nr:Hepar II III N domain-containing protein [Bacteroidota bacterium]
SIPDFDVVYYELGLGVRNRTFIEYYTLPYSRRSWRTHQKMLKTMLGAARWLYELEQWEGYRSGNWQIHGSYMLTQIALTFPEFRESQSWLQLGLQRLKEHLEQDFFEDGGHSERAPRNYTQATYVAYRNLYYLLKEHHLENNFADEIRRRMSRTIDWWITMLAPTGEVPAINDSHRGLFPVFLLQDAATFYEKPEVYGVLKSLFGLSVPVAQPILPSYTSRNMAASGFTVMRTDWSRDALTMTINYGKWNGSHTHQDMLDFEVYAN